MYVDLELDSVQLEYSPFYPVEGTIAADLIKEVQKVDAWGQKAFAPLPQSQQREPFFDLSFERASFIKFMQSVPAGTVSVYCQTLWHEIDKKLQSVDRQNDFLPKQIAAMKQEIFKAGQKQIAQTIFAAERLGDQIDVAIMGVNPIQSVQELFQTALKQTHHRLQSFLDYQRRSGIEDLGLCRSFRLPREIGSALLTEQGQLNIGIIPDLKALFFPANRPPFDYEVMIQQVMDQINPHWQHLFDQIVKPMEEAQSSVQIIRADANLPLDVDLTDLHAKRAVLSALLSHPSQGPLRECFAASSQIKLQDEFLIYILEQYKELIQFGSIGRSVDEKSDRFFFQNTIANGDLQKPILVDPSGRVNGDLFLWQVPNLKFSFRQMGIKEPLRLAQVALQKLGAVFGPVETTPDEVIQAFAVASLDVISGAMLQRQIGAGRYGFSAMDNRLLRAFEAALISKRSDGVRTHLLQTVDALLNPTYELLRGTHPEETVGQFRNRFEESLTKRIRYVYDRAIQDGDLLSGGFQLYDRNPADPYQIGNRISTPKQFQHLILDTVRRVGESLNTGTLASVVSAAVEESSFILWTTKNSAL